MWLEELLLDYEDLCARIDGIRLLGCKGTTGTGASFWSFSRATMRRLYRLEQLIAEKMASRRSIRSAARLIRAKVDFQVLSVLSGIAQSAHKFSNDMRLLSHLKEFDEPFEAGQIGSSAMAYKRNPMRSERIASLSRYVMCDLMNPAFTAAGQWFERTLDDSANKRMSVPEAFLSVDAILSLYINIIEGCKVYDKIIARHLNDELPFMATENILMYCVEEKGGDRQSLHEAIRRHSVAAAQRVKSEGLYNYLIERILGDPAFELTKAEMDKLLDPVKFTGCASEQTSRFLRDYVIPVLEDPENRGLLGMKVEINV